MDIKGWRKFLLKMSKPLTRTGIWKTAIYSLALGTAYNQDVGDPLTAGLCQTLASLPGHGGTYSPPAAILYFVRRSHRRYVFHEGMTYPGTKDSRIEFEDLAWLFQCNPSNRGLISMDFDEAAYLYKIARRLENGNLVEIGRYKGGSTFLLAAASGPKSRILSIDVHSEEQSLRGHSGMKLDQDLRSALNASGLSNNVEIVVADSHQYRVESESYDLVLVDGDHTYEGVRADYENWKRGVKRGGHLLFHDAGNAREYSTYHESVGQLMQSIEVEDWRYFGRCAEVGSLVHFIRTEKPFE